MVLLPRADYDRQDFSEPDVSIKNAEQLETALARLDALWAVREGDAGWAERVALVDAIGEYEDREAEPEPPDPEDAIKFRMEQAGVLRKGLGISPSS
jgi:antitoxin component HigA of HigAB toxin-antitoxin module